MQDNSESTTTIITTTTEPASGSLRRRLAHLAAAAVTATVAFAMIGSTAGAADSCGSAGEADEADQTTGELVGTDSAAAGEYWFVADSFSFGVEREMKESGEKGGTADINIGVGELQECTISKSMDSTSTTLAQYAINGNSTGALGSSDLADWQSNYGQTAATGDFDGDGDVDGRDFLIWQRHAG